MKNYYAFYYLILTIIIISCQTPEKSESLTSLQSEMDTFYLGNILIRIEKIGENEFEGLPEYKFDTSEPNNLLRDSSIIKRNGDTLFFKTVNKIVTLINNNNEDNVDSFSVYKYIGFVKDLHQFVVYGTFYEWYYYLLIDQKTGDTTITCGHPMISPDKKYFISGNTDLTAGFTFNGFELFENSHKPNLKYSRELLKWGPQIIKWKDEKTMLIKAEVSDTTRKALTRIEYFRLSME